MRNTLLALALGGLLAAGANAALYAQDTTSNPPQQMQGHRGMRMDPDQQLAHMTKQLDLTADQQSQIRPILVDRQQKMEALRQDTSLSREDRRSKAEAIQQDTRTRLEASLNDQQKQKFEAMQERMQERREQRMQGGDNQPPASSPQPQ